MAGARKVSTLLFKSPAVTMPWRTSASIVVLAPSSACPPNVYSVPSSSEEEGVESDYKVCLVKRNVSFCLENCTTVLCTLSQRAADRSLVYLCVLNYARPTYPHTHSHAHAHTRARALLHTLLLRLLVVCIQARSSSFADAMVFPGGAIDRADHTAALRFFANPTTCSAASTAEELEEAAFKIGAARELFEEAGINLIRQQRCDGSSSSSSSSGGTHDAVASHDAAAAADALLVGLAEDMAEGGWRDQLRSGHSTWSEMAAAAVEAKQVATSVGTLFDWCSFITPDPEAARLKKGGFFTKFYGAVCDAASVPSASADDAETVMLCWLSPQEALAGAAAGKFFLAPPQYFILTQLAEQCKTMSSVVAHASSDAHRLTREYPIKPYPMKKDPADDAASSVAIAMPGDELHPVFPGLPGCKNRIYMSDKLGQLAAGTSYTFTRKNLDALQFPLGEAKIGMFQTVGKAKL